MNLFTGFFKRQAPRSSTQPGLYHYRIQRPDETARVHLRLEADGSGTLIVNANRILHLNPTAAWMAKQVLDGRSQAEIISAGRQTWDVHPQTLLNDFSTFNFQLGELIRPDGACPVHELELETIAPFSARPSAPYRLDLALTYRCNNDCAHCYNARERQFAELNTEDWRKIIDTAWELGIPHIVFTGGEPTLRDDLPDLIAHAEANGQITGLNTNARRLSDPHFVQKLVEAGLDHVQITVESCDPVIHNQMVRASAFHQTIQGLKNALATRLFVMTNTTMLQTNVHTIPATLDFLADLGVPTIGLNALIYSGKGKSVGTGLPERDLKPLLETARQKTEARGQRLIWYTPTQYCHFDPVQMELGVKGCTAAQYNLCVEPNGDVLPCQSYYHPLGNLLQDEWHTIWNHPLAVKLRERQDLPLKCQGCALLAECGGGCPLQFSTSALHDGLAGI
ncbi:MAG: radical SAM protein [Anaerolineae bacterium]|nr:MAG: radical SAM protein [Anaerolineae bacterium]